MDSREGSSRPSSLEQAERDSTVIVKREVDDRNGEEEEEEEDSGSDEEDDDDDHDNADNEFAVAVQLKKPSLERRTLEQIVSLLNSPYLDLNPPYQREVLTDVCQVEDRMSALVGSIYDNFYVPPVIFNVETVVLPGPEGGVRFKRVCVDGKQRLTSVKAFLDGEIPVKDANYKSWYYQASLNHRTGQPIRNRKVLSERLKKQFREKSLICIEFDGLSREQEEDLFARVQKGMPLNPAEKFRATRGPWQEFATLFEHDFCDVMMLSGNKRSSGWRNLLACFSQVIEVLYSQGDVPKLRTSHQNIAKLLEAEASCDEGIKSHLRRVFTKFASIVRARPDLFKDHNFTRVKTFSPVELVGVTVLISKYPKRNTHMLYGDILYLRKELRLVYRDLKLNLDTWRAVWHLITTLESVRGAADGSTTMKARRSNGTEMEVQHEGQDDDDSDYEDAAPLSASPTKGSSESAETRNEVGTTLWLYIEHPRGRACSRRVYRDFATHFGERAYRRLWTTTSLGSSSEEIADA
ncbi:MAG: hypothetical protein M1838_002049 [Thelocarpon superellum]|nr:MAG: hypothetical protein M1838_002049 [Thelocarpon superellum]